MENVSSKWPNVFCEHCGIVPLLTDEMDAGKLNTHDALDLMCSRCHLVIATLHADCPEAKT